MPDPPVQGPKGSSKAQKRKVKAIQAKINELQTKISELEIKIRANETDQSELRHLRYHENWTTTALCYSLLDLGHQTWHGPNGYPEGYHEGFKEAAVDIRGDYDDICKALDAKKTNGEKLCEEVR